MNPPQGNDEWLDLVDKNDVVIGKKQRSEIIAENLSNFRVVNAFIVNSRGELWIPRRPATKRIFPLCLDFSVGGHVESGETYEDTLRREAQEELNIDVATVPHRLLGHLTPHKDRVSSWMNVWEIHMNDAPHYNPEDFIESFWFTPTALRSRIANGEKTKEDLPKLLNIFYSK